MITRYSPEERARRFGALGHLFDEFFNDRSTEIRSGWVPSVDVKETDNEIDFYVEVPGMKQEDIEVEMVGDMMTIRGKREFSQEERRDDYVRIERSYGSFQRSFNVGIPVKSDQITATYKDGVLTVRVPKADEVQPRRIAITGS